MKTDFYFQTHNNLYYGTRKSREILSIFSNNNYRNIVILVDEGVKNTSAYYEEIHNLISDNSDTLNVIELRGSEEPDYTYLDEIACLVRNIEKIDVIIAIGGGSCMDIAKAAAVLKTNKGKGIEYRGFDKVCNAGIDTILIPTTAGTGSEATINAVFTDKSEMKKLGINGKHMNATYAVLDSKWVESCPKSILVSSGADALTHSLESFMCKQASELTRTLSKKAFELVYVGLKSIAENNQDLETLQKQLLGSYLAGLALFNSGSGISGAFSYPLGVNFKVPHGLCGGVFLADVIDYNVSKGYSDYSELYDLIEKTGELTDLKKSELFASKIKDLMSDLGVPQYLDNYGVTMDKFDYISEMFIPYQAAFDQNPIYFSADKDAKELLLKHMKR